MLIEFCVANFRSFREEQTLSLVASQDETHPGNLIPVDKFNLLKTAAIYGPNASGKSNLIKAIGFMGRFVQISATKMNQGDEISGITPFQLDPHLRTRPSSFEVSAILDKTRFEYGFSATRERVHEEWLTAYPSHKKRQVAQRWFERHFDPNTKEKTWTFGSPLKNAAQLLKKTTRDNGLVLSRGGELNVEHLTELYLWFRKSIWVIDLSYCYFVS